MERQLLLLLRLEGPLQSWGTKARWDVRETGDEPTKSGLIGLLGCALGYPVYDSRLEDLDKQLRMGIRVEHQGVKLRDFHTITGALPTALGGTKGRPDDPDTIISPHYYLQDAAFLAVFSGPPDLLHKCCLALNDTKWPLYLGRKCCPPARPVFESLTEDYSSIEDAIERHRWDWEGKDSLGGKHPERLRYIVEDSTGSILRGDCMRVNPARMYGFRRVRSEYVPFPGLIGG